MSGWPDWQPIETCPRDENVQVLLGGCHGMLDWMDVGTFAPEMERGSIEHYNGDVYVSATHWMALPPPPVQP